MNIQLKAFAASIVFVASLHAVQLPNIVVSSISNYTDENLIFKNRFTGDNVVIPAGQTSYINFLLNNKRNIIINGSLKDVLSKDGQYLVQTVDSSGTIIQESYLHMSTLEGGIDDGTGIIIGAQGTTIFKFLFAGKNGGSQMSTKKIKNDATSVVEVNLEFYTPRSVIEAEYNIVEK